MMEHRCMTAETSLPLRQQCITPQQLSSKWSIERRVTQSTCAFHRQENGQVSRMCITGGTFTAVCDTMLLFTVRSLYFSILTLFFFFFFLPTTRKSRDSLMAQLKFEGDYNYVILIILLSNRSFEGSKAHDIFHIHENWHILRVLSLGGSKRLISSS